MREIKFRGKIKENFVDNQGQVVFKKGKWIYGGIVYDTDRVWIDTEYYGQILVDKETVGQFTGLEDKNENEIYEGDIVKVKYGFDNTELICEIIYLDCAFRTKKFIFGSYYDCLYYWYANDCELEKIGNVWDNPELLEEGE